MKTQSICHIPHSHGSTKQPWERMAGESAKAYSAFVEFKDLGCERTYKKVGERVKKSLQLMARWGQKFNWHNRAADFDEHNAQEMHRELFARRARARKRALDIADELDQKLADAVHMLKVGKIVKVEGQPDESELTISPTELARLFEVSQNIQHRILGKDEDEEIYEFHLHFNAPDPAYEHEQPEAVLAARKKAREEQRQRELEIM